MRRAQKMEQYRFGFRSKGLGQANPAEGRREAIY